MTSKFLNFTACVLLLQLVSSCSAPLSEQCRQLKVARNMSTEFDYAYDRETDPQKKSELLSQSIREQIKILKNLSLSDSHLKGIQEKLIKNKEKLAEFKPGSANSTNQLVQIADESKSISDDLKNYCQS